MKSRSSHEKLTDTITAIKIFIPFSNCVLVDGLINFSFFFTKNELIYLE